MSLRTQDCMELFLKKLGKSYEDCTDEEKSILSDVIYDNSLGRYSKFLQWSTDRRNEFFSWMKERGINYGNLADGERWAVEDAFEMPEDT